MFRHKTLHQYYIPEVITPWSLLSFFNMTWLSFATHTVMIFKSPYTIVVGIIYTSLLSWVSYLLYSMGSFFNDYLIFVEKNPLIAF